MRRFSRRDIVEFRFMNLARPAHICELLEPYTLVQKRADIDSGCLTYVIVASASASYQRLISQNTGSGRV